MELFRIFVDMVDLALQPFFVDSVVARKPITSSSQMD